MGLRRGSGDTRVRRLLTVIVTAALMVLLAFVLAPIVDALLRALEHGMPAGSGIALGFDRLAMLASGARRIEDVLWLPTSTD